MKLFCCCGLLFGLTSLLYAQPGDEPLRPVRPIAVSAPIQYKDTMLVVTDPKGVCAIVFDSEIDEHGKTGVNYRWRYESRGGKMKLNGAGKVYEIRGKRGELSINAGPIKFTWSYGGKGRGWVYYQPEELRMHVANAKNFEENTVQGPRFKHLHPALDLQRYIRIPRRVTSGEKSGE